MNNIGIACLHGAIADPPDPVAEIKKAWHLPDAKRRNAECFF
ncbi:MULTISPECIES: hypothetical protein [Methanocalculus]|nr:MULTISPECIES: hypothetical protein [unclassified Methanocalculus]MCP1662077.1 hypothetical protein [Methanocalculus sp. AMF5]